MAKVIIADEIVRLYSLNMGQADIAKHLNLDLATVEWVIKKMNEPGEVLKF